MTPVGYRPRIADDEMRRGLKAAGFVVIEGPRACGKTWTGLRFARSAVRLDIEVDAAAVGAIDPSTLLAGPSPRLLDEWQVLPSVWNRIRHECDRSNQRGLFILAGSSVPADDITRHTGAGRVRRIRMRPMSLVESGDSSGEVSLAALFDGEPARAASRDRQLSRVAELLCRGGWPGQMDLPLVEVQQNLRDYLDEVARTDVKRLDGAAAHRPERVARLIRSLARNTGTEASNSTLAADAEPEPLHRHTVGSYMGALRRLFVVEEQPAWSGSLRSRASLRRSPKHHLADPSLAAAVLGASPKRLMADPATLGTLFESLVVRDLRVYSQPIGGRVSHVRDSTGAEADATIELPDGRCLLVEVKLGGADAIDAAADSLQRLASKLQTPHPPVLAAITAVGYGYRRRDGINVIPITTLAP